MAAGSKAPSLPSGSEAPPGRPEDGNPQREGEDTRLGSPSLPVRRSASLPLAPSPGPLCLSKFLSGYRAARSSPDKSSRLGCSAKAGDLYLNSRKRRIHHPDGCWTLEFARVFWGGAAWGAFRINPGRAAAKDEDLVARSWRGPSSPGSPFPPKRKHLTSCCSLLYFSNEPESVVQPLRGEGPKIWASAFFIVLLSMKTDKEFPGEGKLIRPGWFQRAPI